MFKIVKSMDDGTNQKVLAIKEEFVFPAGEVSVKLNVNDYAYKYFDAPFQTIVARIQNSDGLFKLALLKDALQRFDPTPINLFITYLPYARQDRVCDGGEAFSLAVLARFIASLRFNHVTLFDPHSDVAQGCFEALEVPLTVIRQNDVIHKYQAFSNFASNRLLVSPDVGANKKTSVIAGYFNHSGFIRADKLRVFKYRIVGEVTDSIVLNDHFDTNFVRPDSEPAPEYRVEPTVMEVAQKNVDIQSNQSWLDGRKAGVKDGRGHQKRLFYECDRNTDFTNYSKEYVLGYLVGYKIGRES